MTSTTGWSRSDAVYLAGAMVFIGPILAVTASFWVGSQALLVWPVYVAWVVFDIMRDHRRARINWERTGL